MATSVTVDISDSNYTQMDTYVTERSSTNASFINSAITHYLSFLKGEYDD